MSLEQLQRAFQGYLLGRTAQMPSVNEARERLDIYRLGYVSRLVEALGNDYPGLKALLGATAFADAARRYIADHPSAHYSLRWLGQGLPDHLAAQGEALAAGMARFDWAVALAFDAADEAIVGLPDLLALPAEAWAHFSLRFAVAASLITADTATGDLRRALLHDEPVSEAVPGLSVAWLVWRSGEDVQYRALPADEAACFAWMQGGMSFARMCESLAQDFHEANAAQRGAEMLQDWLQRGLVSEIVC
ncbi:DNA-binding domain-containing protein [Dongia rigui]|uniref:DNA-binding domain-containing protein n=1 Tax=Dongia rigui TaxID=940149 RepID=A0ABU5E153_9PROT|nr:DNA-binding domain-containing protein [Dongia rigui]MDY0872551.1 DNA-binding domain-containing protein [Dongia rigui]